MTSASPPVPDGGSDDLIADVSEQTAVVDEDALAPWHTAVERVDGDRLRVRYLRVSVDRPGAAGPGGTMAHAGFNVVDGTVEAAGSDDPEPAMVERAQAALDDYLAANPDARRIAQQRHTGIDVFTLSDGSPIEQFTITDPDGDVVLALEPGDAIELTFVNTLADREDTVQGVIERIRQATDPEETVIELSTDVSFRVAAGGNVRFGDRSRGHLPRTEPVESTIRWLFD